MNQSKTVLVLGATGGIGGEVAKRLFERGWNIRALTRNLEVAKVLERKDYEWIKGDALARADVINSAKGVSLIIHAVNPPGYRNWEKVVLPMLENTIAAAEANLARVLLPGTLYNYGESSPDRIDESTPQVPSSRKGRIRKEMEDRLQAMVLRGRGRALIVRAGDFFGPEPGGNWFSQAMIQPGKPVQFIALPGKRGVGHAWAYIPDLAEAMVRITEKEAELSNFEAFQFQGHMDKDGAAIGDAIQAYYPDRNILRFHVPWSLVRALAPFSHIAREMADVSYLWKRPFHFDNQRLEKLIGSEPHTPLNDAVAIVLKALNC